MKVVKLNANSKRVKIKLNESSLDSAESEKRKNLEEETRRRELRKKELDEFYKKGFDDGQNSIKDEFEKIYNQKLLSKAEEFNKIAKALEQKIVELEKSFDRIVIEISTFATEKILSREIDKDSNFIKILKDSLNKVIGSDNVVIKLHPEDYAETAKENLKELFQGAFAKIKFDQDENIEKGGCYIETEIGNVDARVSSRLAELKRSLEANILENE